MTWEIVTGLIALCGFLISIGKIVANNTKAMTEVKISIDELKLALKENKDNVKELQEDVAKHETRITIKERKE